MQHDLGWKGGYLLLEDGRRFDGELFYGDSPSLGEVVFNTSHTGYQEILTDPSYRQQIMVFTAPHIGNVGVNSLDEESGQIQTAAAVVRSLAPRASSWRAKSTLDEWMARSSVPLLSGVDTRAVTLYIRSRGAMRAGLFPPDVTERAALERVVDSPSMDGADLATTASCRSPYELCPEDYCDRVGPSEGVLRPVKTGGEGRCVGLLDLGVKRSIIDELLRRGCRVKVIPANTRVEVILDDRSLDGVLLSNGPGDPAATAEPLRTAKALLDRCLSSGLPLFGICLGHQLLALAAGLETYKLPFGHRGANHPVRREADGRIEITSQNHGFAVKRDGLGHGFEVSHYNLNDGTVEGLGHREAPVFSIQYHPESSPGPHDGLSYFDEFMAMMSRGSCGEEGDDAQTS